MTSNQQAKNRAREAVTLSITIRRVDFKQSSVGKSTST